MIRSSGPKPSRGKGYAKSFSGKYHNHGHSKRPKKKSHECLTSMSPLAHLAILLTAWASPFK